jgi:hypothetical protein
MGQSGIDSAFKEPVMVTETVCTWVGAEAPCLTVKVGRERDQRIGRHMELPRG